MQQTLLSDDEKRQILKTAYRDYGLPSLWENLMKTQNVFSSHIDTVGYDEHTKELHVVFSKGKTAVYQGVPAVLAASVMNAPSVGQALNENVKGVYPHRYL